MRAVCGEKHFLFSAIHSSSDIIFWPNLDLGESTVEDHATVSWNLIMQQIKANKPDTIFLQTDALHYVISMDSNNSKRWYNSFWKDQEIFFQRELLEGAIF